MNADEKRAFLMQVFDESIFAERKFPYPNPNLAALMEEVGEVAQAFLKGEPMGNIRMECIQVASMAMRCALEGDPQFINAKDAPEEVDA